MKEIEKYFEQFTDYLEREVAAGRQIPDFSDLCGSLGAPKDELDSYLMEQFGLGGDDIVRSYRTSTPIPFL